MSNSSLLVMLREWLIPVSSVVNLFLWLASLLACWLGCLQLSDRERKGDDCSELIVGTDWSGQKKQPIMGHIISRWQGGGGDDERNQELGTFILCFKGLDMYRVFFPSNKLASSVDAILICKSNHWLTHSLTHSLTIAPKKLKYGKPLGSTLQVNLL